MEWIILIGVIGFLLYFILKNDSSKSTKKKSNNIVTVSTSSDNFDKKNSSKTKIKLKNKEAEKLRKDGTVTIDGIQINLWQNHNQQTVKDQLTWNKLGSVSELNLKSTGENGNIILTGVFQIPRKEVAAYATQLNFKIKTEVSKFIDYIVIGTENVSPSKIAKALEYNKNKGANIKFITEDTFLTLIAENIEI